MNVPTVISSRAEECLQLLESWKRHAGSKQPRAENAVLLFRLWVTNNFVFTNDRMCLDWRLRSTAVLVSVIQGLLDAFKVNLSKILPLLRNPTISHSVTSDIIARGDTDRTADSNLEHLDAVSEEIEQLEDTQTRLFDLCQAIHRSGILSRLSRIANYRELLEFDGKVIDLSQHYRIGIKKIVQKRHPYALESTRSRLVDTICLRRQNFRYLQDREAKVFQTISHGQTSSSVEVTPSFDPLGQRAASANPDIRKGTMTASQNRKVSARASSTIFTSSTVNAQKVFKTQSVRTSSTFLESKYLAIDGMMPPPPEAADDTGYIKCPYCFLVCPAQELQGKYWKRHFIRDLMPYVCLLDECSAPETLYESFGEWTAHMTNQHSTTIWTCTSRSHSVPARFHAKTDFEKHMREEHSDEFIESDLEELAESSAIFRPRREPMTSCPLCVDAFDANSMPVNDILNHVTEHMLSLALLSLPEDENYGPAKSNSFGSIKSSTSQSRVSRANTITEAMRSDQAKNGQEEDVRDDELSSDIDRLPDLPSTEDDHWYQFWEGNPLPTYTTPEGSLLKGLQHRSEEERKLEDQEKEEETEEEAEVTKRASQLTLKRSETLETEKRDHNILSMIYSSLQASQQQDGPFQGWRLQVPIQERAAQAQILYYSLRMPAGSNDIVTCFNIAIDFEREQWNGSPSEEVYKQAIREKLSSIRNQRQPMAQYTVNPLFLSSAQDMHTTADTPSVVPEENTSRQADQQTPTALEVPKKRAGFRETVRRFFSPKAEKEPSVSSAGEARTTKPSDKLEEPQEIDLDSIIDRLVEVRGSRPGEQVQLLQAEIMYLCRKGREVLISQPILLELEAPLTICGDIHGQYHDLLSCFESSGFPPEANYLFLGNYVDYGKQSLEVICLLLAYKIKYPENFFLLRGNHEDAAVTRINGFYDECKRRYSIRLWKTFVDVFNCLPVAAIIDERIFAMHGGLSPDLNSMEQIRRIMRPTTIPDVGLLCDLLNGNPDGGITGWGENTTTDSGIDPFSFTFGADIVSRFLLKHDMHLIVRSNEVVEEGYEFFANRQLVTIFSAPNFKGEYDNAGAMLKIDESLLCSFIILKPAKLNLFQRPRSELSGEESMIGQNVNSSESQFTQGESNSIQRPRTLLYGYESEISVPKASIRAGLGSQFPQGESSPHAGSAILDLKESEDTLED